jgi:hypothetical protein
MLSRACGVFLFFSKDLACKFSMFLSPLPLCSFDSFLVFVYVPISSWYLWSCPSLSFFVELASIMAESSPYCHGCVCSLKWKDSCFISVSDEI